MSDIVIRNMDMPKTCKECIEMKIPVRCRVIKQEPVTAVMTGYNRPKDCPLVELPPHGRLIDADALIKNVKLSRITPQITSSEDLIEYIELYAILDKFDRTIILEASEA